LFAVLSKKIKLGGEEEATLRFSAGLILVLFLAPIAPAQNIDPPTVLEQSWEENDNHNFLKPGDVTREQILSLKVYNYNYVEYVPKADPVEAIYNCKEPVEIRVFWGDWSKDCKKYVPALIKTLEFSDNGRIQIKYFNLGRDKKTPAELLEGTGVSTVPVIVVFSGGKEAGRIVETPVRSVEEDLAKILTGLEEKESQGE